MTIKSSGRRVSLLAAALWLCAAAPMHAAENDASAPDSAAQSEDGTEAPAVATKSVRHRATKKAEAKPRKLEKSVPKPSGKAEDSAAKADDPAAPLAPAVANANAQLRKDAPADMGSMSAQADAMLKLMGSKPTDVDAASPARQPAAQLVSVDQLSDADRSLAPEKIVAPEKPVVRLAKATIDPPEVVARNNSVWSETSFIGKVFIAFGGLLTMASAVRMFVT